MTQPDVAAYRRRLDELHALVERVTDPQALQAVKDEIARLEGILTDAGVSKSGRGPP